MNVSKMKFKIIGKGKPIVMIHGWAMNYEVFMPFIDQMDKEKFKFILFNVPKLNSTVTWNDALGEIKKNLLELELKEFDLLGWSLGGHIALDLYQFLKSSIKKIFLVSSTPKFIKGPDWEFAIDEKIFNSFAESIKNNTENTLYRFFNLQLLGQSKRKELIDFLMQTVKKDKADPVSLDLYLSSMRVNFYLDFIFDALEKIYLIAGAKDKIVPIEAQYQIYKKSKNKHLILNDASHIPFLTHINECKFYMESVYE